MWDNKLPANFFFFSWAGQLPCFRCSLKWKREGALTHHSLHACGRRCLFRKRQESKNLKRGEADWAAVRRECRTKFPKAKTEALVLYTYVFYSSHTNDVTMMPHNATTMPIFSFLSVALIRPPATSGVYKVGFHARPGSFKAVRRPCTHFTRASGSRLSLSKACTC